MSAYETLVLDGLTISSDQTGTLLLEDFQDPIPKARFDWIGAADSEWQALSRAPLHENRTITLKIRVAQQATMDQALDQVGSLVDKLRKASLTDAGIAMTYTPAGSTRTVTFDVLAGEIDGLPKTWSGDDAGWFLRSPVLTVTLTCKPYWRGSEILTSQVSSSTPITTLEIANVPGDIPALGRLIVSDGASQNRRHLEWGLESPLYYQSSTSLLIDSDNLTVTGFAGSQLASQGYDPNATGANVVRATLYGEPLAVAGTGNQTHVGRFRVKARVTTGSIPVFVRLAWQIGDGPWSRNSWAPLDASTGDYYELDLGTIHVPPVTAGTQRWRAQVEMYSKVDGALIDLDYLILIPVDAGYGKARANYSWRAGTLNGYDRFAGATPGGALDTRVSPLGGTWSSLLDSPDFVFDAGMGIAPDDTMSVSRTSSAADVVGRTATIGVGSFTDTEIGAAVTIDIQTAGATAVVDPVRMGVLSRYVSSVDYLLTSLRFDTATKAFQFETRIVISGAVTVLATQAVQGPNAKVTIDPVSQIYRIVSIVYASGRFWSALFSVGGALLAEQSGSRTALATGGVLASGKRGIFDSMLGASSGTSYRRYYGDVYMATPSPEPMVVYSGQSAQVRHDDTIRLDAAGTYYGRPESYNGSRFLVPPGTSRALVKARRMDVDEVPDTNVTDMTLVQAAYQPRGLVVPR